MGALESRFAPLIEAFIIRTASEALVNAVARKVGERDAVLLRIIAHHVGSALARVDHFQTEDADERSPNVQTTDHALRRLEEGRLFFGVTKNSMEPIVPSYV